MLTYANALTLNVLSALIFKPLVRIKRAWHHLSDLNVADETVTVITRRYIASS